QHVADTKRGQVSKDTIPVEVREWIEADMRSAGLIRAQMFQLTGTRIDPATIRIKTGYRRKTLERIAEATGSQRLQDLAASDVYWDRVVSIEYVGEEDVYDLEIEGDHNFVADGLIV